MTNQTPGGIFGSAVFSLDRVEGCLSQAAAQCQDSAGGQRQLLGLFLSLLQREVGADLLRIWECDGGHSQLVRSLPQTDGPVAAPLQGGAVASAGVASSEVLRVASEVLTGGATVSVQRDVSAQRISLCVGAELAGGIVLVAELAGRSGMLVPEAGLGEILADLRRREQTLEYRQLQQVQRVRDLMLERLQGLREAGDLERVAGSEFAGVYRCRRIVVCRRTAGGRWEASAGSAGGELNRRSEAVAEIERQVLAASRAAGQGAGSGEVVVLPVGRLVLPVTANGGWAGAVRALHVEYLADDRPDAAGLQQAVRNLALACERADTVRAVISGGFWRRYGWLLAVPVVLGLLLPTELRIAAEGELQPVRRQSVFAPESGVVERVEGTEGRDLVAQDFLLQLRSDELQLQAEQVLGELAAAQARLSAIESLRAGGETSDAGLLNAEQAELSVRVRSLQQQREILSRRQGSLLVSAPLSGRLIGAEFTERLVGRPVQRGQRLCEVVQTDGEWQLRLWISERDVGYVGAAWAAESGEKRLTFLLESDPARTWQAAGGSLSQSVELGSRGQLQTELTVPLTGIEWRELRPGSGVKALISCGQRPAGFVWFRRLIESVGSAAAY